MLTVARELRCDIEEEVDPDYAERAARVICGVTPFSAPRRSDFALPTSIVREQEQSWQDALERFEVLIHVAREAWHIERRPPGIAFRELCLLREAVYEDRRRHSSDRSGKARATTIGNLLECLRPSGLERRVAENSRGMLGTNSPMAHLLLEAHSTLLGFARRHDLIDVNLAERTARHLLQLKNKLGFPAVHFRER
jgi:hypothetical protein